MSGNWKNFHEILEDQLARLVARMLGFAAWKLKTMDLQTFAEQTALNRIVWLFRGLDWTILDHELAA